MKAIMFADGAKGAATQVWVNDDYGITLTLKRPSRQTVFAQTWSALCLPNIEFKSYASLREAMKATND